MKEVDPAIRRILIEYFQVPESEVRPDAYLEDLLSDSLDLAEFTVVLSGEFGVKVTDDEIREIQTVRQVTHFIDDLLRSE